MHIFTSPYCFVAGTAILTGAGYVAIEYIKKGDIVWSTNPDTGETALNRGSPDISLGSRYNISIQL